MAHNKPSLSWDSNSCLLDYTLL